MKTLKERISYEKEKLDEKAQRLADFINSEKINKIDKEHTRLLSKQYDVMREYSEILRERIELLNTNGKDRN